MNLLRFGIAVLAGATIGYLGGTALKQSDYHRFAQAVTTQGMRTTLYDPEPITIAIGPATSEEQKIGLAGEDPGWAGESVRALEAELHSAPGFYPEACGLEHVRIMQDMSFEDEAIDGFYTRGVVYLDADTHDPRSVAIHELNHLCVDRRGSLLFFPWMLSYNRFTGARYTGDDWNHAPVPGFARGYGTKNRFEDIATVAEHVIGNPELSDRLAERDETYADKARRVRSFYEQLGYPLGSPEATFGTNE